MTRTRRLGVAATLAAVLLAGAAGCGDDDSQRSQDDPTSPAPSTTASDPSEIHQRVGQRVGRRSGIPVRHAGHRDRAGRGDVRRPGAGGWEQQDALLDYASAAIEPGKLNTIQLADSGSISGGASLDALAQGAIKTLPSGADVQRLPDVDLGGVPAFHLHYTVPQDPQEYDVITTERNGRNVGLDFVLVKKNAATNPDLIASVLATFRWTA